MKNPERVAKLIAELKSLTENQFEQHRIDVLERDLESPPVVEVIDDTHQKFDGVTYVLVTDGHYRHLCSVHRAVYNYYYGGVEKDFAIHHIDENKANNEISNLQLLTKTEHHKLHRPKGYEMACHKNFKEFTCRTCGKKFVACSNGKNCYCSEQCRTKGNYIHKHKDHVCQWCGKTFQSARSDVRFCSPYCRNKSRYSKTKN